MGAPRIDRLDRNLLINGNFDYWQRGTTVAGASIYGPDRWKGNSAIASAERIDRTFSAALPIGSRYGMRLTSAVGGGASLQRIEASKLVGLTGKYVTFSFKAGLVTGTTQLSVRVNTPTVIDNYAARNFGSPVTVGTPQLHTVAYDTFKHTFQVTSEMESKGFEIDVEGDATVWSIIFSQMMLVQTNDAGEDLIPEEYCYAGRDVIEEEVICQRYYWRNNVPSAGALGTCYAESTVLAYFVQKFPVTMRAATQVLSVSANGHFAIREANTNIAMTSPNYISSGVDQARIGFNVAGGLTDNQACQAVSTDNAAWMAFDAEL